MTHPDYRSLCVELTDKLHEYATANPVHDTDQLVARARAALATPEQGAPSDELAKLVTALRDPHRWARLTGDHLNRAAELLESYGTQAVPVPVAERLPGEGDYCPHPRRKPGEWCWGLEHGRTSHGLECVWRFMSRDDIASEAEAWAPHWAFPLPDSPHWALPLP